LGSNKSRGLRKKAGPDDAVPALIESEVSSKEFRNNWARQMLDKLKKTYSVLTAQPRANMPKTLRFAMIRAK
jgi:hypothetical protein